MAQTDQGAASSAHNDEIVKMRMQIAAANKKYNQQVAAAKKVFDHKKAEAAKERDAAVAAAHNGVSGQQVVRAQLAVYRYVLKVDE